MAHPDSAVLADPLARLMALDDVAGLAIDLTEMRAELLGQARQPGVVTKSRRAVTLPDLAAVRDTGRELWAIADAVRRYDPDVLNAGHLGLGAQQGSVIRTPDPVEELTERIKRLRQHAWQAATAVGIPEISTHALADIAATGVALNVSAAVLAARIAGSDARDPSAPAVVGRLLAKAEAWRHARDGLLRIHTIGIHDPAISEEARSIARLLQHLVPAAQGAGAAPETAAAIRAHAALRADVEMLDQVAHWNSRTVTRLVRAGQIYLPGRLLTGDQITDHPDLVTAKLENTFARAPVERAQTLLAHYETAAQSTSDPSVPARPDIKPMSADPPAMG